MNINCPNCAGQVSYDPVEGVMVCESCGMKISSEDFASLAGREKYDSENTTSETPSPASSPIAWDKPPAEPVPYTRRDSEYMDIQVHVCNACGAELMINETEAATFCSYCGSSAIVFDRISKEEKPKWIIPFKLNRELALEAIRRHFTERDYIPSKIKALTLDKIHAIYIPYWLFTTNLRRELIVKGCGHDGTFQYDKDASCTYSNLTMDASRKLKDGIAKRLEPFHMNELIPFDIAYLSGYYADAYDVPVAELEKANLERCRAFIDDAIIRACPSANQFNGIKNFETHFVRETHVTEKAEYALLPAYFVNLKYDTGRELVVVNGQTGKVVGNLPYEKEKIVRKMIKNSLIACPIFIALFCVFFLIPDLLPFSFLVPVFTFFMVLGGVLEFRKHKHGTKQLTSSSMRSYVNDREDNT